MKLLALLFALAVHGDVLVRPLNPQFPFALVATTEITAVAPVFIHGDTGMSAGNAGSNAVTPLPPSVRHFEDGQGQIAQDNAVLIKAQFMPPPTCSVVAAISGATTIFPGSYCYASALALSGTLTLDAQGNPDALFIFNVLSSITTDTAFQIMLINGARSCAVYWLVGQSVTMGTATVFVGNVIAGQSITTVTGTSVTGFLVAQTAAITLGDQTTVSALGQADCSAATTTSMTTTSTSTTSTSTTLTSTIPPTTTAMSTTSTSTTLLSTVTATSTFPESTTTMIIGTE
jgi:hypothetical protein